MRLSARNVQPETTVAPDAVRPIRLRFGGLVYAMDPAEALDLATQLADAVASLKQPRALEIFNTDKEQA